MSIPPPPRQPMHEYTRTHTHPKLYLSPLEIIQGQGGEAGGDQSHRKTGTEKQGGDQGWSEMPDRRA